MKPVDSKEIGELVIQITAVGIHPNTGQEETTVWEYEMSEGEKAMIKFMHLKQQESDCYSVSINIVLKKTKMNISEDKSSLANSIADIDSGLSNSMTDCERYGMTWGCDIDCPVLQAGKCEIQDTDNKELYQEYLNEYE